MGEFRTVGVQFEARGFDDFLGTLRGAENAARNFASQLDEIGSHSAKLESGLHGAGEAANQFGEHAHSAAGHAHNLGSELEHIAGHVATEALHLVAEGALKAAEGLAHLGEKAAHIGFEALVNGAEIAKEAIVKLGEEALHVFEHVGKESVSLAGDYQEAMNRVRFITQGTDQDMAELNKSAIEIGKTTTFSSKQAAEGMVILAQEGYNTNQIMTLNKAAANAAMIANTDLKTGINQLTTVMLGFGIPAEKANEALDMMVKTTQMGKMDFDEFSREVSRVGATAQMTGQSFASVNAEMLVLKSTGMSLNQASNLMSSSLLKLSKPNKEAAAEIKNLGLQIYDAGGKMVPFSSIVEQLQNKTSAMTDQQRNYTLATIFGTQNVKIFADAMLAEKQVMIDGHEVTKKGADLLKYYEDQINGSAGATEKAGEILKTGFNYQLKQLKGSTEEALISIGNGLLPVLTKLVGSVTGVVNKFIDWELEHHKLQQAGRVLVDGLTTLTGAIQGTWSFDPNAKINPFVAALGRIGLFIKGDVIPALHLAHAEFVIFVDGLEGKIDKPVTAFAKLGTEIHRVVDDAILAFKGFKAGLDGIAVPANATGIIGTFDKIGLTIHNLEPKIEATAKKIFTLYEAFSPLTNAFKIFEGVVNGGVNGGIVAFQQAITNAGKALGMDFTGAATQAGSILTNFFDIFKGLDQPLHTVLDGVGNLAMAVLKLVDPIIQVIDKSGLMRSALEDVDIVLNTFQQAISVLSSGVQTNMGGIVNAVHTFADAFQSALRLGQDIVVTFAQIISNNMNTITDILNNMGSVGKTVFDILKTAFDNMKPGIEKLVAGILRVADSFSTSLKGAIESLKGPLDVFSHVLGFAADVIGTTLPMAINLALTPLKLLFNAIETGSNVFDKLTKGDLGGAFSALADGAGRTGDILMQKTNPSLSDTMGKVGDTTLKLLEAKGVVLGHTGALFGMIPALQGVMNAHTAMAGEVARAASAVDQLKSSMQQQSQAMSETGQQMAALDQKIASMPSNVQALWKEFQEYTNKMREGGAGSDEWSSKADQVKAQLSAIDPKLKNTADAWQIASEKNKEATKAYQDNTEATVLATAKQTEMESALNKSSDSASNMPSAFKPATDAVLKIGESFGMVPPKAQAGMDKTKNVVASSDFSAQGQQVGSSVGSGISAGIQSKINAIIQVAVAAVNAAISAAKAAAQSKSPSKKAQKEIGEPISEGMAVGIKAKAPEASKAAEETALDILSKAENVISSISKAVDSGTGAFAKLKSYTAANLDAVNQFASDITNTVLIFEGAASKTDEKGLEASGKFADAASKIVGLFSAGVTGFAALNKYHAVSMDAVNQFASDTTNTVIIFESAAANVDEKGLDAAGKFVDAASKIVGMIGSGVAGFVALDKYKAASKDAIGQFATDIMITVSDFVFYAQGFQEEGLKAATTYAETASKIIGIIASGVNGFAALEKYKAISRDAMNQFATDVMSAVSDFVFYAQGFQEEGLKAANTYSDTAAKVVGLIANAVQGFTALQTYKRIPSDTIQAFNDDIRLTVSLASEAANNMNKDMLTQVGLFGDAVGHIFNGFKSAMEVFQGLEKFKSTPSAVIQSFVNEVIYTVSLATDMTQKTDKDLLAQVSQFGDAVGRIFNGLKSAMDLFKSLESFKGYPADAINQLISGIETTLKLMANLVARSADYLKAAEAYKDNIEKGANAIKQANQSSKDAASGGGPGGGPGGSGTPPGKAGGGGVGKGGVFMTGEKGPEMVFLPEGSYVLDAKKTQDLVNQTVKPVASATQIFNQAMASNQYNTRSTQINAHLHMQSMRSSENVKADFYQMLATIPAS